MPIDTHTKVLYSLIALLIVGFGFVVYQIEKRPSLATQGTSLGGPLPVGSSTVISLASVTVGSAPAATSLFGTISQINSTTLQIKEQSGAMQTVAITADTKVQLDGAMKDQLTMQKEMAAYNAQLQVLMKDPIKNKAALAALQVPAAQVVTNGSLSDLAAGDFVMVTLAGDPTSGTLTAALISKPTTSSGK